MRNALKSSLIVLAGIAAIATPALARERLTGEQELAKLIEGRVAGEGRSCISTHPTSNFRVIDGTALVYRQGSTLWVNVPRNAEDLDDNDVLVTKQFGSQLCRQDMVDTYSNSGWFYTGTLFLGDFVPYRKVAVAD